MTKMIPLGLSLSMAAAIQIVSGTAHAQTPPAPPPAGAAVAPTAPAPPPPSPYPPPPPAFGAYPPNPVAPGLPPPSGPVVSLFADNPKARLQQQNQLRWEDVCLTPCGRPVDPSGLYRVGGGVIMPSDAFRLPRPDGQVVVQANTGSKIKRWVGFGLGMGGVGAAAVGGLLLAVAKDTTSTDTFGNTYTKNTIRTEGIIYLITGGVLMLIGFPMFAANNTSVQVR